MAVFTSESQSQEILNQQQQQGEEKAIITHKSSSSSSSSSSTIDEEYQHQQQHNNNKKDDNAEGDDDEVILWKPQPRIKKPKKRVPQVCLEGYVEPSDDDEIPRTKSLTDDDLDELKGCVDLGFGFSYDEIPELCNTLPALELCYSMSQKFLDDHPNQQQQSSNGKTVGGGSSDTASSSGSESSSPMPTWKISSPGDHPEDVKARLKFWAQAVACTVRLCS
ncbi:Sulfate adenylyltransferase [Bienertia sinuspersici]